MSLLVWIFVPSVIVLAAVSIRANVQSGRHPSWREKSLRDPTRASCSVEMETHAFYEKCLERIKALLGLPPSFGFLVEPDGPYPQGHAQAVSWLAIQVAQEAGLSGQGIEEIRMAGLLHDIGKMHVPWHLLNKPASLTPEEYEVVKSHAAFGEEMLRPFGLKNVGRIVRHHHERFDGKGYPDGLAGDTIPLGARIVAVAECFDDMVSDQPYRSARTFEDAVAEIRRCSGTQFDPKIVAAFVRSLRDWADPDSDFPLKRELPTPGLSSRVLTGRPPD